MADAAYEDGGGGPLYLGAEDGDDLKIIATLAQDAVLKLGDARFMRPRREFVMLINRFRWEDAPQNRPFERVRALLWVRNVLSVRSTGIDHGQKDQVLALLDVQFTLQDDGPKGQLHLICADHRSILLEVEALDLTLRDVTRPYYAPSGKMPLHKE